MMAQLRGNPGLHFWLTRSVAKVMGISLTEAMAENRLSARDYATMVTACRQCALVENCQYWLSAQTALSASPPPGCVNAEILNSLIKPQ
jgi:hypothetical protein